MYFRDGIFPAKRIRVCIGENENSRLMFGMLRVITCNREEFDTLLTMASLSHLHSIREAMIPICITNEIKAMNLLIELCKEYLKSYPTSFDEDDERLSTNDPKPFSNERNALIQIRGEKLVLMHYIDLANTSLELLSIPISNDKLFSETLTKIMHSNKDVIYQHCRGQLAKLRREEKLKEQLRSR